MGRIDWMRSSLVGSLLILCMISDLLAPTGRDKTLHHKISSQNRTKLSHNVLRHNKPGVIQIRSGSCNLPRAYHPSPSDPGLLLLPSCPPSHIANPCCVPLTLRVTAYLRPRQQKPSDMQANSTVIPLLLVCVQSQAAAERTCNMCPLDETLRCRL
jgi:hypothetical protein